MTPSGRAAQLLECATRVFARRGIGEARHAEIAAEAGVAVATVFVYFPTREALVNAVLDEVERFYIAMLEETRNAGGEADASSMMLKCAQAFADSVDAHPDYARIFLEWSVAVREEIWPRYLSFQRKVCAILEGIILSGLRAGVTKIDPEDAALLVVSAAHTVAQLKFVGCAPTRLERFLRALVRAAVTASSTTTSGSRGRRAR